MKRYRAILVTVCGIAAAGLTAPASAELLLSQVIVDLPPQGPSIDDIEAYNSGEERLYVVAQPYEVTAAGTNDEQRTAVVDPAASGLFVSPRKIILEPGERRTIRIAAVGPRPVHERIFRVSIKPVAGVVTANRSALKVFVGYDALVIVRPSQIEGTLQATREAEKLVLHNSSNASLEIFDGRQCDSSGQNCVSLPGKRLYAGASWEVPAPFASPVRFKTAQSGQIIETTF